MDLAEALIVWMMLFLLNVAKFCLGIVVAFVALVVDVVFDLIFVAFDVDLDNKLWRLIPRKGWLVETRDDIDDLLLWFERLPPIKCGKWEMVASIQPPFDYLRRLRQFYPATIVDFNMLDDPTFWPHQISSVYMIEIERNADEAFYGPKLIVWRVSLLNGCRTKVHEFEDDVLWYGRPICFQSNGVVFIYFREWPYDWLYVYDTRDGESRKYKIQFRTDAISEDSVSISCSRRFWTPDGKLKGWKIRIVNALDKWPDFVFENGEWIFRGHASIVNSVFDLRDKAELIEEEEIRFGYFISRPHMRRVRTSVGFGLYVENKSNDADDQEIVGDGPTMLYDEATKSYDYKANFDELREDEQFDKYVDLPSPVEEEIESLCPVYLSDRECVEGFENGTVFRHEFAAATLKYIVAKKIFRSFPDLRFRMTADQFRRAIGVSDMEAHFNQRQ